jgi:hypothetical protein
MWPLVIVFVITTFVLEMLSGTALNQKQSQSKERSAKLAAQFTEYAAVGIYELRKGGGFAPPRVISAVTNNVKNSLGLDEIDTSALCDGKSVSCSSPGQWGLIIGPEPWNASQPAAYIFRNPDSTPFGLQQLRNTYVFLVRRNALSGKLSTTLLGFYCESCLPSHNLLYQPNGGPMNWPIPSAVAQYIGANALTLVVAG